MKDSDIAFTLHMFLSDGDTLIRERINDVVLCAYRWPESRKKTINRITTAVNFFAL
jgi:hypothetical protein